MSNLITNFKQSKSLKLSDNLTSFRAVYPVRQRDMFKLSRNGWLNGVGQIFNPLEEQVAKNIQVEDALYKSKIYPQVIEEDRLVRTDEYAFLRRDPNDEFGKEILFIEHGIRYRKIIPDIAVRSGDRIISLQKAKGLAVYPSISLLKVEQLDDKEFLVSPAVDLCHLRVEIVNFAIGRWAATDFMGVPVLSKPSSKINNARYGYVRADEGFEGNSNGLHGSIGRMTGGPLKYKEEAIHVCFPWEHKSYVAITSL